METTRRFRVVIDDIGDERFRVNLPEARVAKLLDHSETLRDMHGKLPISLKLRPAMINYSRWIRYIFRSWSERNHHDFQLLRTIRRPSPPIRLILIPKQLLLHGLLTAAPATVRGAALEQAMSAAERFDRAAIPTLDNLRKIGLTEVGRTAQRPLANKVTDSEVPSEIRIGEGFFEVLSFVRAVAIGLKNEEKVDQVLDAADRHFEVVLDDRNESERALRGKRRYRRTKPPQNPWPDWTGAGAARAANIRGAGVSVGILDTGINADHAEFRGKAVDFRYVPPGSSERAQDIRSVRGFDTDGHGTHVCGIIAGKRTGSCPKSISMSPRLSKARH